MNLQEKKYDDWTGVNNSDDPMNISTSELADAENVTFTNAGEFVVRKGAYNPLATELGAKELWYFIPANQIIYQTDNSLYVFNENDGTSTQIRNITGDDILGVAYCTADGRLYFSSLEQALFSWDGNVMRDVPGDIFGRALKWYQNHLFIGGQARIGTGAAYDSRVFISPLGDPSGDTAWNPDDWLPAPGNGSIQAMEELGDHVLVIGKDKSIFFATGYGLNSWKLTEDNDASTNVDNSIGVCGPRAFIRVANELWFMDTNGQVRVVYQTDFDPFRKTYRSERIMGWTALISKAFMSQAKMLYFDDKVWVFAPDVTGENSLVFVFDLLAARRAKLKEDGTMGESWTRFTGDDWKIDGACVTYTGSSNQLVLLSGDRLLLYGGNNDLGKPIKSLARTKMDDFGKYSQKKRYMLFFAKADILNENDVVSVYISIDSGEDGYIGDLIPSEDGAILRNDDDSGGNFTLNANELGLPAPTDDDTLGFYTPEPTKLRYDTSGFRCKGRAIQHVFKASSLDEVQVSKVSSNFRAREIS